METPEPRLLEFEKAGGKKPDLRFTVGSGCDILGIKKIGML